jgi:glycosyltransferase involved in cell wall biosynthesis
VQTDTNPRPRVAIIYRLDHPGGVQSVVLSLIKGLNQRGIVPDLVWDTPPNTAMLAEKGVQAGFLPVRMPVPSQVLDRVPKTLRYILRLPDLITSDRLSREYDFLYIFYNGFIVTDGTPHIYYLSGPPLLPQLDSASPGIRGLPYRSLRWLYRSLLHRHFPVYDYHPQLNYVINSDFTAALFFETYGVRLPVVHPPIDITGRNFTSTDLQHRNTVTFFSRFVDYKRPEMVLALAQQFPQYRFVLMGGVKPQEKGYFETLRSRVTADGLANVNILANPSETKVRGELQRTRFYIFPAVKEHFGMTTVEAIASGAIPFVHDSGGQREIVPDARLRFSDPTFIEQFSRLITMPPDELNHIRQHLQDHIQGFSENVFIAKMLNFLDSPVESEMTHELQAAAV